MSPLRRCAVARVNQTNRRLSSSSRVAHVGTAAMDDIHQLRSPSPSLSHTRCCRTALAFPNWIRMCSLCAAEHPMPQRNRSRCLRRFFPHRFSVSKRKSISLTFSRLFVPIQFGSFSIPLGGCIQLKRDNFFNFNLSSFLIFNLLHNRRAAHAQPARFTFKKYIISSIRCC